MSHRFSHLVWLGAGAAAEPANVLSLAESVSLFEAREAACVSLKKTYSQKNINVIQAVLTADGGPVEFTEYNLSEYSAVQTIAGLKALFPGIKSVKKEQVKSVSITEVIKALALEGSNNLLIFDILDCKLALMAALQKNKQLIKFCQIYVHAGSEPLYDGAATKVEITSFLEEHGYLLHQTDGLDPDLPWLIFRLNPLWQILEQAQQANTLLTSQIEQITLELRQTQDELDVNKKTVQKIMSEVSNQDTSLEKRRIEQLAQQLIQKTNEHEELQQTLSEVSLSAEKTHAELNIRIEELNAELIEHQEKISRESRYAIEIETKLTKNLEHLEQVSIELEKKLEMTKQDFSAEVKKTAELTLSVNNQLNVIKSLENSVEEHFRNFQEKEDEMTKSFHSEKEKISKQLLIKSKQVKEKQEQVDELTLAKKALELERMNLKTRLDGCVEQLARADAQYQLIKDLILARGLKGNER